MIEHRGGEADRVDAAEYSRMAFDECARGNFATVAFDGGQRHRAGRSHHGDQGRHGRRLPPRRKRGCPVERHAENCRRAGTAQKPFPGARRIDIFGNKMFAKQAAKDELEQLGDQNHRDEEKQKPGVGVVVVHTLALQKQEGRCKAQAIDADQEPKLDLGNPFEKPVRVARDRHPGCDKQECIDGDENAIELVAVACDEEKLHRGEEKEDPEEGPMVAQACRRERNKFAQCPERQQTEKQDRQRGLKKGDSQDEAKKPPSVDPAIERIDRPIVESQRSLPLQPAAGEGRQRKQRQHNAQQCPVFDHLLAILEADDGFSCSSKKLGLGFSRFKPNRRAERERRE